MILVRCNVSNKIGTGHFYRMKNFTDTFKKKKIFLINSAQKDSTIFKNCNVFYVEKKKEFLVFKDLIDKFPIELIVLDLKKYQKKYIEKLKHVLQKPIISFHEFSDYSAYSNICINYNFCNENDIITKNVLIGTKYFILNKQIDEFKMKKKEDYIFAFFGGSDPNNLTELFIKNIVMKIPTKNFLIKVGSLARFNQSDWKMKNLKFADDSQEIYEYMLNSQLCVLSGGNIMYESIYLNKTTFVISQNYHQEKFASIGSKKKLLMCFGKFPNINFKLLRTYINSSLFKLNQQNEIDGKGVDRIKKLIKRLKIL